MNFLMITTCWGRSDVVTGNNENLLVSPLHGMIVTWEEDQGKNLDVPLTQSICSGKIQNSELKTCQKSENLRKLLNRK